MRNLQQKLSKKKQGIRDSGFIRKDKKRLAASSQRLQSILKSYGFTLRVFESESFKTSRSSRVRL